MRRIIVDWISQKNTMWSIRFQIINERGTWLHLSIVKQENGRIWYQNITNMLLTTIPCAFQILQGHNGRSEDTPLSLCLSFALSFGITAVSIKWVIWQQPWEATGINVMDSNDYAQPWWRHQMETFSALLALCAGNSPLTDLRLNKRLGKQWWGWWFETPSRPLLRHCNASNLLYRHVVEHRVCVPLFPA